MHLKPVKVTKHVAYKRRVGLGDAVQKVLKPVARVVDKVAGTNLQNCNGCKARAQKLNQLVPDIKHPLKRDG